MNIHIDASASLVFGVKIGEPCEMACFLDGLRLLDTVVYDQHIDVLFEDGEYSEYLEYLRIDENPYKMVIDIFEYNDSDCKYYILTPVWDINNRFTSKVRPLPDFKNGYIRTTKDYNLLEINPEELLNIPKHSKNIKEFKKWFKDHNLKIPSEPKWHLASYLS